MSTYEIVIDILRQFDRPMGGLEIVKASDGQIGRGTVYTLLSDMEEDGFVRRSREKSVRPGCSEPRQLFERRV